jgi:ABC-type glutathione transport system ATPase component
MTPLVSFVNVSKRYTDGWREIVALDRVSLEIEAGVSVGVYGARRSGKSTLLRLAAGILAPDSGSVRFDGRDTAQMTLAERGRLLRGSIAFMTAGDWRADPRETVVDHVASALEVDGVARAEARRRALGFLEEVGVSVSDAAETAASLSLAEGTRVMLARALARGPRLLVLDDSPAMPTLHDRDRFYALLRSAARERSMALMMAAEEMAALQGVGVLMSIAGGELCSTSERGTLLRLPPRGSDARSGASVLDGVG